MNYCNILYKINNARVHFVIEKPGSHALSQIRRRVRKN